MNWRVDELLIEVSDVWVRRGGRVGKWMGAGWVCRLGLLGEGDAGPTLLYKQIRITDGLASWHRFSGLAPCDLIVPTKYSATIKE